MEKDRIIFQLTSYRQLHSSFPGVPCSPGSGASNSFHLKIVPPDGNLNVIWASKRLCSWVETSWPRALFLAVIPKLKHRSDCLTFRGPTMLYFHALPTSLIDLQTKSFIQAAAQAMAADFRYLPPGLHWQFVEDMQMYWRRWNKFLEDLHYETNNQAVLARTACFGVDNGGVSVNSVENRTLGATGF